MKIFARLKGNLNIKEKWQDICAIEFKKKIKIVLVFLGIMAGLTVLSRITYNMILPEVVMGQAEPGTVNHEISTQAEVRSLSEIPVFTEEGLLVDGVRVREGQKVSNGEILYTLDKDSLDRLIEEGQNEAEALRKQINQLRADSEGDEPTEVYSLQSEKDKKERSLQEYRKVKAAGYAVRAGQNGIVTKINTATGDKTQGTADMLIADSGKNLTAVSVMEADEESRYIGENTVADITASDGTVFEDLSVASITAKESEQTMTVSIPLPEGDFYLGQLVSVELYSSSKTYECCIPRTALNMEGSSYFLYTVSEEATILGKEYTVEKLEVQVLDKNREIAAVEGISSGQKIIVRSDKPIEAGNKVRKDQ